MARTLSFAALVVVTILVVAIYYVPLGHVDFLENWGEGTLGIDMPQQSGTIEHVAPGSPADRAGIRAGDRVIENGNDPAAWARARSAYPGERLRVTFVHDGVRRTAIVEGIARDGFGVWQRITGVLAYLPPSIFLAVAVVLVALRPSVMAWSLYVFAVGYFGTAPVFMFWSHVLSPQGYTALSFVLSTFFGPWSALPLLPFVLRFPNGDVLGWRKNVDPFVWGLLAVAYALYVYEFTLVFPGNPFPWWSPLTEAVLPLFSFVLAALIVGKNYAVSAPSDRQRWSFLALGTIASFVAYAIYYIPGVPFTVGVVVGFGVVLMPICIAYAIFRLRVLDVTFVLNRAVVYGSISIGVIAFISLLDWTLARVVEIGRLAIGIELLVTIAIGFLLDRINRVTEGFIESVFFRGRRRAEAYLRRAAQALPYATEESAIADGLVGVPVDALKLVAAALYRRSLDGKRFEGVATSVETAVAPPGFDTNHLLTRMLLANEKPVWLDELRAWLDPENAAVYTLAVPVTVRHELVSFTLYGAHANGAQLDPEEVELLEELAREASRAYDHVEAVRVRERYARVTMEASPETA